MTLPAPLKTGIEELVREVGPRELERASRALSDAYRAGGAPASRAARTTGDVAAYLATRAPATYAAAADVYGQIALLRPDWRPVSLLDLGAGPGIATWAALEEWPTIGTATLVEAEPEMVRAGRALARHGRTPVQHAEWVVSRDGARDSEADLVVVSYVLGELAPAALGAFVERAWASTADTLVLVEPGTTGGYHRVLAARDLVLAAGGSTLAPCPHDGSCPLPAGDWCHFATRLARSPTHRRAKGAERGFEDEKYAYAALCRACHPRPSARVLRRPDRRPGHVVLALCTDTGLERRTVSKKEGATYRAARKLGWGDAL